MLAEMSPGPEKNQQRPVPDDRADAVRYAVLQRIAPAMRHQMVASLQPIGMIYELMEHRMANGGADAQALQENAGRISRLAKAAMLSSIEAMTWLERDSGVMVAVTQGVRESMDMLGKTLGFMGFKLVNEVADSDCRVPRDALRSTLTSALLAAADSARFPSDLILQSRACGHDLAISVLVLAAQPGGRTLQAFEENCRRLNWDDVKAVAMAEAVGFVRHDHGVTLVFPV
jgi:hypothetical protein